MKDRETQRRERESERGRQTRIEEDLEIKRQTGREREIVRYEDSREIGRLREIVTDEDIEGDTESERR